MYVTPFVIAMILLGSPALQARATGHAPPAWGMRAQGRSGPSVAVTEPGGHMGSSSADQAGVPSPGRVRGLGSPRVPDARYGDDVGATPPANTLYVSGDSTAALGAAWRACVRTLPALVGPARVKGPSHRWIALQARPFDTVPPAIIHVAGRSLSKALHTDVLFLQITRDGRAWYFYWNDGRLRDQYCSNPGRIAEVGHAILRAWTGKPEVLLGVCRGVPLSTKRSEPTLTDLNTLLYYYPPEMRLTQPAAYRTPDDLLEKLASVLGLPCAPARWPRQDGFIPL